MLVDGDEVTGVVDWSKADDVVAGYGGDIEIDVIRAYWSLRSLMEIRWLVEHGYGAPATFPQVAVLNSLSASG